MMTRNKELAKHYAPYSYELTDEPYFGYQIHVCKLSCGWLPLFQGHKDGINSVAEYRAAFQHIGVDLFDEYGTQYSWYAFKEKVLKFNGGVLGTVEPWKLDNDKEGRFYDPNLPEYGPISHIRGNKQSYQYNGFPEVDDDYFVDSNGFEFCRSDFC